MILPKEFLKKKIKNKMFYNLFEIDELNPEQAEVWEKLKAVNTPKKYRMPRDRARGCTTYDTT